MHPLARYTQRSREFAFKNPVFTEVNIQMNYWVISFWLLGTIFYFYDLALTRFLPGIEPVPYWEGFRTSVMVGVVYGFGTGIIRSLVIKRRLDHLSSIGRLAVETLVYFVFFILVWNLAFMFVEASVMKRGFKNVNEDLFIEFQLYNSVGVIVYVFFNILLLNFILQINTKYGPGVLIPMLLGYYRHPEVEERVFLFMDLKNSTGIAEKLGHILYSELIRDCFKQANYSVMRHNAQIYQYVGDEIVLSWERKSGVKQHRCLNFYLDFQTNLKSLEPEFLEKYGIMPEFKAGLHVGEVTAIEVGVVKRDIAYHGDTINAASRVQDLCNVLKRNLLFSKDLKAALESEGEIPYLEAIGEHKLKGRKVKLELYSVNIDRAELAGEI